jgi:hypothetical protein
VWRWLAEGREGRVGACPRRGGFVMGDALWAVLTQAGGNVAELWRGMLRAQDEGVLGTLRRSSCRRWRRCTVR